MEDQICSSLKQIIKKTNRFGSLKNKRSCNKISTVKSASVKEHGKRGFGVFADTYMGSKLRTSKPNWAFRWSFYTCWEEEMNMSEET
jgi:hypothetical protein